VNVPIGVLLWLMIYPMMLKVDFGAIGGIGRSDWRDGPDLFLRAASIVSRRHPDLPVRFVWVGAPDDGPSRWILDHDVRCAGLADKVTFMGTQAEAEEWIGAFDVLCLTTRMDPPPPAALQAGAMAVPVVGFAQGGLRQMALDAGGPPAVHSVDYLDVEGMAEAVAALVADPDLRAEGGERIQHSILGHRLTVDGAPEVWDVLRTVLTQGGHR
jgi:glycosyltransferase involved in cell wall biosynthesis